MRFMHVITGLSIGGAEQAMFRLLCHMEEKELMVVSLTTKGVLGKSLEANGFQVEALGMNFYNFPIVFYKLYRLMKRHRPSIVQTWLYHSDLIGGLAAKVSGIRNIVWNIRSTDLRRGSFVTMLVRKFCAYLSFYIPIKIIVVAHRSKARHVQIGFDSSKIEVISNGFDVKDYEFSHADISSFRKSLGIRDGEIVVGCVGRFSQVKGQDIFVKAACNIVEKFPDTKFLMVGRGIEVTNIDLMTMFDDINHLSNFIMLGERSDIKLCLSSMDIFCLPSRSEGFPNALGEAMLAGVPCVSTNVGDAAIMGGVDIPYAIPDNIDDLTEKLTFMIRKSEKERSELGKRLKLRIIENFSIQKMVARYKDIYHSFEVKS